MEAAKSTKITILRIRQIPAISLARSKQVAGQSELAVM